MLCKIIQHAFFFFALKRLHLLLLIHPYQKFGPVLPSQTLLDHEHHGMAGAAIGENLLAAGILGKTEIFILGLGRPGCAWRSHGEEKRDGKTGTQKKRSITPPVDKRS